MHIQFSTPVENLMSLEKSEYKIITHIHKTKHNKKILKLGLGDMYRLKNSMGQPHLHC